MIPQKAAKLTRDHGDAVGGKLHVLAQIEAVNGLNQADAAHLKKVVHALAPVGKLLHNGKHQPEIAGNQLLSGGLIAVMSLFQQTPGLRTFQNRKLRRIDAANLHFCLHILLLSAL